MSAINELLEDHAFTRCYVAVLQSHLWQEQHVKGGAEDHVILAYYGTATGAPKFLARAARRWAEHPEAGWHVVAQVNADGTITPPTDQK